MCVSSHGIILRLPCYAMVIISETDITLCETNVTSHEMVMTSRKMTPLSWEVGRLIMLPWEQWLHFMRPDYFMYMYRYLWADVPFFLVKYI